MEQVAGHRDVNVNMKEKKPARLYGWIPLFLLCVMAYWIQINMAIHHDVAIISHTAALMLEGQTYAHDFFEPNPPLIFYVNLLPVIISKITGIKIIYVLRLYILALIMISVVCSRALLRIVFRSSQLLIHVMTIGLMCILLFLPGEAFGQREHFLLIFTIPYLFLAACRLDNKTVKPFFAFLIGLMAGVGFSIKPFFLPTLLLIELLFVYRNKRVWGWIRIESVVASLVILSYGVGVILFCSDYWHVVLPLWLPYYRAIVMPWSVLLTCPLFLFCCAAFLLWCFTAKEKPFTMIKAVLGLSIFGYLITFLIPRVEWYYHVLPALSMACLYFLLVFGELVEQFSQGKKRVLDLGVLIVLAMLVFSLPVYYGAMYTIRSIQFFHSNNPIKQLITFLNQHQKKNSYHFLGATHHLAILEFYSSASYVGSFAFCSWEYSPPGKYGSLSYVLNVTSRDLDEKKPEFVFIDIPSTQARLNRTIDFPKEYAHDTHFRDAWSHYRYVSTITPYDIYQRVEL